jgi:hypothetical protein
MKWNLEIINKVACHYVTHVRVFLRVCVPAKASLAASHLALVAARAVSPGRELQSLFESLSEGELLFVHTSIYATE